MAKAREEKQMRKVVEKNLNKKKDHTVEHEGRKRMVSCGQKARSLRRLLEHRKDVSSSNALLVYAFFGEYKCIYM